jgi:hypothetical protein
MSLYIYMLQFLQGIYQGMGFLGPNVQLHATTLFDKLLQKSW